jgi:hypothetical protein
MQGVSAHSEVDMRSGMGRAVAGKTLGLMVDSGLAGTEMWACCRVAE